MISGIHLHLGGLFAMLALRAVCASMIAVLAAAGAFAQSTGLIEGTVVDPGEAAVSGAHVACSNVNTGIRLETRTNSEGIFRFPEVPVGTYELTASLPGFQVMRERADLLTGDKLNLK